MRVKTIALTLMLAASFFVSLVNIPSVSSAEEARVYVNPIISYALPNEEFTITVRIADVVNLYSWQVNMTFNATVLQYLNVTKGEFLKDQPEGTVFLANADKAHQGIIFFGETTWGGQYAGVSGDGVLATVKFKVLIQGESIIDINHNKTLYTIPYPPPPPPGQKPIQEKDPIKENGLFTNLVAPPVAKFTVSTNMPEINQMVTFNASESFAVAPLQIVSYNWTFGDGTNGTGMIVQHAYSKGANYTATLTVVDNATASNLVRSVFNTTATAMPFVWYELYGSAKKNLLIAFSVDIAVVAVQVSSENVTAGDIVTINVTVKNLGIETTSFNVTASYDSTLIETKKTVTDLSPGSNVTKTFTWDTTGVPGDIYQIAGEAVDVKDDGDLKNNKFLYPNIITVTGGSSFSLPITWIAAIVVVVIVLGVGVFWYLRRRGASS